MYIPAVVGAGAPVVGEPAAAVVVLLAMVVMGEGVVLPLQTWIRPIESSSAFLQAENLLRQVDLEALIISNVALALQDNALVSSTSLAAAA